MRLLFIIIASLTLTNCAKKEVKIPTLAEKGIQEVQNHSQVWMFLKVENGDTIADINKKNTISSTHWIFNIDKRLPLQSFIPTLKKLQVKHAGSLHSKEGMHNYFSYSDTVSKKLSFLEFDTVEFITDSILSKDFVRENGDNYANYYNLNLTFNPNNAWINDAKIEEPDFKNILLEFIEFSSEGRQTMLHLNFNQELPYQDYLHYKTMVYNLNKISILTNFKEFIFDPTKVPDCGCE